MKKDELQKLRGKSLAELKNKIAELGKQISQSKLEKEAGKLKNVAELAKLRRDLAQVFTVLRLKELTSTSSGISSFAEKEDIK